MEVPKLREQLEQVLEAGLVDEDFLREKHGIARELLASGDHINLFLSGQVELNPFFSTSTYLQQVDEEIAGDYLALWHFLMIGCYKGLRPHWIFEKDDIELIDESISNTSAKKIFDVISDASTEVSAYFSKSFYLKKNPDIRNAGISPLRHFLVAGIGENRQWSEWFKLPYLGSSPQEIYETNLSAFAKIVDDARSGQVTLNNFEPKWYKSHYPDSSRAPNPFYHYIRFGRDRGYQQNPVQQRMADRRTSLKFYMEENIGDDYQQSVSLINTIRSSRIESFIEQEPSFRALSEVECLLLNFPPPVAQPLVSIVISAHNQGDLLSACLSSIASSNTTVSYDLILVDDASSDDLVKIFSRHPRITYIESLDNVGFGAANNLALEFISGKYVLFLNSDTVVSDNWLEGLIGPMERDATIGAVGPKLIYPNGRLQEAGVSLNSRLEATMVGLFDDPDLPPYQVSRSVDYCSGACLAVRSDFFVRRKGFDEILQPAYAEDLDLCLDLRSNGFKIWYAHDVTIVHRLSASYGSKPSGLKLLYSSRNLEKVRKKYADRLDQMVCGRVVAFYLPQYHSIPENDRWWGKGFTEWTNVSKAAPQFPGHYQPHMPSDLGFYDLLRPDVLVQQAQLARRYGVDGFCFYYYNFGGKRLLEKPLDMLLQNKDIDINFCVCWANETWSRRWDGRESDVLIAQDYSSLNADAIIADLCRYADDPRYLRVDGRPLIAIYRSTDIPDWPAVAQRWRNFARRQGIGELYLTAVESFDLGNRDYSFRDLGFDNAIEFPPQGYGIEFADANAEGSSFLGCYYDYLSSIHYQAQRQDLRPPRIRGCFPSWDNTARKGNNSHIFRGVSPDKFRAHLERTFELTRDFSVGDERLVFINAWNEWAEGAHLEPDVRYGHRWLEAIRAARTFVGI